MSRRGEFTWLTRQDDATGCACWTVCLEHRTGPGCPSVVGHFFTWHAHSLVAMPNTAELTK